MARRLSREGGLPHLDLDLLAWSTPGVRKPVPDSVEEIDAFRAAHPEWVAEGCYADLLKAILPDATEIRFLNPGIETCVANCLARPWEPEKYSSKEEQDAMLAFLVEWVREYETRDDEYSLGEHRRLFEAFGGSKVELNELEANHPHGNKQ